MVARHNSLDCQLLFSLNKPTNCDMLDVYGVCPLHVACHNTNENMVRLLLEHGANVNLPNRDHGTPLMVLCSMISSDKDLSIVKLLIGYGTDVNTQKVDSLGWQYNQL